MTTTAEFAAELIRSSQRGLASAALVRLESDHAELLAQLPSSFATPRDDVLVRLQHLAAAVEFDRAELFAHSVQWYAVALRHRAVPDAYLAATLQALRVALIDELPRSAQPAATRILDAGVAALRNVEFEPTPHLDVTTPRGRLAGQFLLATLEGRADDAVALVRQALQDGMTVPQLHDEILVPVQRETGRMWLIGEIQVAEEHFSSQVVDRVLWAAQDHIAQPPADAPRVLLMGTSGDNHSFGLRMIAQRLQAEGLRVHNLGPDMPPQDLESVLAERFDVIAVSATMPLHLHSMSILVTELRRLVGEATPIVAGGAPFAIAPDLFRAIGADAAATDGTSASAEIRRLLDAR